MSSNLRRGVRAFAIAIGLAVGGIVAGATVSLLLSLVIQSLGIRLGSVSQFGLVFVGGALGFGGLAVGYLRYRDKPVSYVGFSLPSLRDLLWAVGGYLTAIALVITSSILLTLLEVKPDTANQAAQAGMENPSLLLWLVPISIFVVAPSEEILYRGVIQSRLRETFKPVVAIPLTAALFALVHFFSLTGGAGGRFVAIGILFFPSLVFGTVYEKTDNLLVPIVIHGVYNSTLVLLLYASMQFTGGQPALLAPL